MFLINLYRQLFGFVILKIYGEFPQRLLNLCAKNHITSWNLHKRQNHIELCVMIRDFKRLRKVRAESRVKIKILKKCGLPFVITKYKLRIGVVLGIAVFFVTLKLLSCFVWEIDVVGAKSLSKDEILGICEKHGIYVGQYIKNIDTVISKDEILLDSDKLAWGALNIEGSKITINLTEVKSETPDFLPSNIIATDDAVIKKVKVLSGNPQITVGEAVQKGDLLISGTVDVGDKVNFIKSSGEILGEIETKIAITKTYIQQRKRYTGLVKQKYVVEFFGLKLPMFLGEIKGDFTETYSKNQMKFLNHNIPITVYKKKYDFYEVYDAKFTKSELIEQIESEFEKQIKEENLQEIMVVSREIYTFDDSVTVEYVIKHIKNICREENLIITTLN